ncbi:metallophosphoesterase [Oscillospiraceae bacterium WX1]
MSTYAKLTQVYKKSIQIPYNDDSKIVLIGDCHRGDGSWIDNFLHNRPLYYAALRHYYDGGFTYIDLGDSEELWKFKSLRDISSIYIDIYRLLHHFYAENRLFMIYGNHDMAKKDPQYVRENMARYYDNHTNQYEPLFENITVHEGLILRHAVTEKELFLVHGHQGDLRDDQFWRSGRFFVRHFWRRMELLGFKDITSAAKNNVKKKRVERSLTQWAVQNNTYIVAGHTHRPVCPLDPKIPYFNVGSAVHPSCITCLELVGNALTLVKWSVRPTENLLLSVARQEIAVPRSLSV